MISDATFQSFPILIQLMDDHHERFGRATFFCIGHRDVHRRIGFSHVAG
jgi:hypothetical protein